jgi:hypothetical protein
MEDGVPGAANNTGGAALAKTLGSCAGLTRASMMNVSGKETYLRLTLWSVIMDCRVKPGNDGTEPHTCCPPLIWISAPFT